MRRFHPARVADQSEIGFIQHIPLSLGNVVLLDVAQHLAKLCHVPRGGAGGNLPCDKTR